MTMHTNRDAIDFISQAIEASGTDVAKPNQYDLDAIAVELHHITGSWDMSKPNHDTFWAAVERHELPASVRYLKDARTAEILDVASPEQVEASDKSDGDGGIFLVDADGDVIAPQNEGQPWVKGTRRVYVD